MMAWDPVWEEIFRQRDSWGKYPPEELVRFIARSYYQVPHRAAIKVLEVGCGPGSGPSWFIAREGFSLSGIDGSPTAIAKAKANFSKENLHGEFVVGDLAELPWPEDYFDCVIDVHCLQCNDEPDTRTIISQIHRVLKPGGKHFSSTVGRGTWGDASGKVVDGTTVTAISEGPLSGMGVNRFATSESLLDLYASFQSIELNYSVRSMDYTAHEIKNWILTCSKPL